MASSAMQGSFVGAMYDSSGWAILQKAGLQLPCIEVKSQEEFLATHSLRLRGMS